MYYAFCIYADITVNIILKNIYRAPSRKSPERLRRYKNTLVLSTPLPPPPPPHTHTHTHTVWLTVTADWALNADFPWPLYSVFSPPRSAHCRQTWHTRSSRRTGSSRTTCPLSGPAQRSTSGPADCWASDRR